MSNTIKLKKYVSTITTESTESRKRSIYSNIKDEKRNSLIPDSIVAEPHHDSKHCKQPQSCISKPRMKLPVKVDSLGSTVGLTCSNAPIVRPCNCDEVEMHHQTLAKDFSRYLKAFALIYVLPADQWTADNIDTLLSEGEDILEVSTDLDAKDETTPAFNNYISIEQSIKRHFKLEGHKFTLELKPPYLGDNRKSAERQPPHIIRNLRPVLVGFFRRAHYCLLLYKSGYLLIWRRHHVYFVMDLKGRRPDDLVSDRNGVAMLVCLRSIDNVVHLINTLSGLNPEDKFLLRELSVARLVTPDGQVFMHESNDLTPNYNVINENYAYLKSNLHLSLNPDVTLHNCSSIVVCVAAILASKIDHPASWNVHMFDHLICYGVELCRSCLGDNLEKRRSIDLDTFPTQLRLGQFVVDLKLLPNVSRGIWRCGICQRNNDFEHELRKNLKNYGNAVFQINNQIYALWFKDNFFYLLDPYRHTLVCPEVRQANASSTKWATVRMFHDLLSMLNAFHQLLRESNKQSLFFIHVVHVKHMAVCPPGQSLKRVPSDAEWDDKCLNETINFPEQLSHCSKDLEHISDYEPDLDENINFKETKCQLPSERTESDCKRVVFSDSVNTSLFFSSSLGTYHTPALASLQFPQSVTDISFRSVESKDPETELIELVNQVNSVQTPPPPIKPKKKNPKIPTNTPKTALKENIRPVSPESTPKPLAQNSITPPSTPKKPNDARKDQPAKLTNPRKKKNMPDRQSIIKPVKFIPPSENASSVAETNMGDRQSIIKPVKFIPPSENASSVAETNCNLFAQFCNEPIKDQVKTERRQELLNRSQSQTSRGRRTKSSCISDLRLVGGKKSASSDGSDTYFTDVQLKSEPNPNNQVVNLNPSGLNENIQNNIQTSYVSALETSEKSSEIMYDPLKYPIYMKDPQYLAVVGSESGSMESLNKLLDTAFELTNRVLALTPWGNYVVFKQPVGMARDNFVYYLFNGCTCTIDRFRHLDLKSGTAGFLPFTTQADVVCYMIDAREMQSPEILGSHLDPPFRRAENILGRCT